MSVHPEEAGQPLMVTLPNGHRIERSLFEARRIDARERRNGRIAAPNREQQRRWRRLEKAEQRRLSRTARVVAD